MMNKLTSRKFWACVVGVVTGLAMVFELDQNVITTVAGAVTSLVSVVAYMYTEGKIDTARVSNTADTIKDAIEKVSDSNE